MKREIHANLKDKEYLSILLITWFMVWVSLFCVLKYLHTNS